MSVSASGDYGVVSAAAGREKVTLHGTLGAPVSFSFFGQQPDNPPFDVVHAAWLFSGVASAFNSIERGQVQRSGWSAGDLSTYTSHNVDTDWVIPNDYQDGPYYIRAQYDNTGLNEIPSAGSSIPKVIGSPDAAIDWLVITNGIHNRFWRASTNGTFTDTRRFLLKIEISKTQSESGIVATGFYRAIANADI